MKQSDIFTVIAVAVVGVVISSILLNLILGSPDEKYVSFKVVEVIEPELESPNPEVFNPDAINPTVEVFVGECIDQDQNGELDEAELIACGRVDASTETNESDSGEE